MRKEGDRLPARGRASKVGELRRGQGLGRTARAEEAGVEEREELHRSLARAGEGETGSAAAAEHQKNGCG